MDDRRPNILIVTMDAVRAENISALGYSRPTTPNLERWLDRVAAYPHAISAASWTMPSVTSLFTGTYPSTHRLVIDGDRLSPRFETLPDLLRRKGYYTAKVTGTVPYVSDFSGLDRGFQHQYEAPPPALRRWWRKLKRKKAGHQAAGAMREGLEMGVDLEKEVPISSGDGWQTRARYWATGFYDVGAANCMREVRRLWMEHRGRPRFVYMHLQETHAPYRPRHRYRTRFLRPELRGRNFGAINQRPTPHDVGLVSMSAEDYEILTSLYDGCIAYLDAQIGGLLDFLSTRPDFNNTLVIVTADHGDCLGRHGVLGHQFVVYDALTRIPCFIKWPGGFGLTGRRSELIQQVDLLPTVSELLGVNTPEQCEGTSILSGERSVAFSELLKPFSPSAVRQRLHERAPHLHRAALAARSRTHKLIVYSNGQPDELFDLVADPTESSNLLGGDPLDAGAELEHGRLRAALDSRRPEWEDAAREIDYRMLHGEDVAIEPEVEQRLRALGYLD